MRFSYKARTKQGEVKRGTIEASSRKVALDILEKYGLYVTSLKELKKGSLWNINIALTRISTKDLIIFTRQFGVMLKSAIPPVRALRSQVAQTRNPVFREKLVKMAEGIETGSSLSQVFSAHPDVFDNFFVSIVKSGEATGKVADSLGYLAEHLERDYNLSQKIRGALIYPAFVIVVFIGAFFLVSFFIVPKLTEILQAFSGDLPWTTKGMMALSNFVRKGGWVVLAIILVALFLSPIILRKNRKTKGHFDRLLLQLPVIGAFLKKVSLVRFAENFSVLISAGLPITQALSITKDIISSTVYKKIMSEAESKVAKGEKISSVFKDHPKEVYSFVTQMVLTGEETGRLDTILMDVVRFYREEIERTTSNLSVILEPVLILALGIGIAILAISIFIPLFQIGMGGGAM